jgi:RNA polymerase sigma factor (sigma-70 family)
MPPKQDEPSASGLEPVGALEDSLQLLERFRSAGDPHALNALFARYYERVRRIAYIRSGPRLLRWVEHDDLVQNTFAAALRGIDELDLRRHSSIIAYLSRVLENQIRGAVDHFEAQKRTPASGAAASVERGSEALSRLDPPSSDPSPADQAAARELKELYDECVRALEPAHREVVLLREYTEASWEEIRAALNRPNEHAAQQLYARAQIKLAAKFRQRLGR